MTMAGGVIERMVMPNTYARYLAQTFSDHARLTAGTGLPADELIDYPDEIAVADVLVALANAAAMARSADWHLEWAKGMAEQFHGPVTMAWISAPTLGDGIDAFIQYMPSRVPYFSWRGCSDGDEFACELSELIAFGAVRHLVIEIPILVMHEYVSTMRAGPLAGARIELKYGPTAHRSSYPKWFGCPVYFGSDRNAFVFPQAWRDTKNAGYDEHTWVAALRRCKQTSVVSKEIGALAMVRKEIFACFDNDAGTKAPATLQIIAERLHVSSRTLIRRLRAAGTTYQEIVDELQKERAGRLLADQRLKIYQVASELGFEDPASFGRSFKRWHGMTPGAYRALNFNGENQEE
jgi:AraC-like DNA-binding protein